MGLRGEQSSREGRRRHPRCVSRQRTRGSLSQRRDCPGPRNSDRKFHQRHQSGSGCALSTAAAALGRLAIPALPDTVVTIEGDLLHADIGHPAAWRVTVKGTRLMQLARLSGGRIVEVVTRDDGGRLLYEVPGRRKLWLGITRDEEVPAFDASIWGP